MDRPPAGAQSRSGTRRVPPRIWASVGGGRRRIGHARRVGGDAMPSPPSARSATPDDGRPREDLAGAGIDGDDLAGGGGHGHAQAIVGQGHAQDRDPADRPQRRRPGRLAGCRRSARSCRASDVSSASTAPPSVPTTADAATDRGPGRRPGHRPGGDFLATDQVVGHELVATWPRRSARRPARPGCRVHPAWLDEDVPDRRPQRALAVTRSSPKRRARPAIAYLARWGWVNS